MKKAAFKFVVRAVISVILIALLYRRVDLSVLGDRLFHLQPWPLIAFFAILFVNTFISAAKWWMFLRADGIAIPLWKVYVSYFVAGFFTVLLPSTIGGDTYRIYDIARRGVKTGHIVASVFADRLTGFLADRLEPHSAACDPAAAPGGLRPPDDGGLVPLPTDVRAADDGAHAR